MPRSGAGGQEPGQDAVRPRQQGKGAAPLASPPVPTGPGKGGRLAALGLAAFLTALVACAGLARVPEGLEQPGDRFYQGTRIPMLANHDGYYFLRLARDWREGRYAPLDQGNGRERPDPPRLIVPLAAAVARTLGQPVEWAAYYLPLVLSLGMVAVYAAWGGALGRGTAVVFAALAGATAPFWVENAGPGLFDAKVLTPVFFHLAAFFLWRFSTQTHRRWLPGGLFAITSVLFAAWWWPGLVLCGLLLAAYACSLGLPAPLWERRLKLGLLAAFLLAGAFAVLAPAGLRPAWLNHGLDVLANHLRLAFKLGGEEAAVGQAIEELQAVSPDSVAREMSGHPLVFLFALAGLGATLWRHRAACLFLSPALLLAVCSLRVERFILLGFPLAALGLGWGAEALAGYAAGKAPASRRSLVRWGTTAALLGLLVPNVLDLESKRPVQPFTGREDALLAPVRDSGEQGVVWTWWDYGYFVQDRTGRPCFFDGGMQTRASLFVNGLPLACTDPDLAANWIHFFAAHGLEEFGRLSGRLGSEQQAALFLTEALSGRDLAELGRRHDLSWITDPQAYLFPRNRAWLYLPAGFLTTSEHWYWFGRQYLEANPPRMNHVNVFPQEALRIEAAKRRLFAPEKHLGGGEAGYGTLVRTGGAFTLEAATAGRADPYLVIPEGLPRAYLVDGLAARTLAFRLLAAVGYAHPRFRPVAYDQTTGGLWAVE